MRNYQYKFFEVIGVRIQEVRKNIIKYNEIESVEIDDFSITRTVLLLTGIGAIVLLGALAGSAPGAGGF